MEDENRKLSGELFKRETNIDSLNKNLSELEQKVSSNHLLPDKIEDLQKEQF
jgi:predicted nuclease with TOPRIM domain